ncbi:OmpA family protein [Mucilaginibacter pallidiroseus]|uniref:OmpA family protein n=1 Tax=Mucilaginibacter pallidiroseus TaxID=2599295 RepID=A0A563UIY6_9SPHI|nr:OmpA family protein [Mucilaginibacter pallidiroseus]TWR31350.1 OmpA family protein [Mucilaginibacter pallidiroseus]
MRLLFLSILFLVVTCLQSFAQNNRYSTTNKKAIEHFLKGNSLIDEHLYDEAAAEFQEAIKDDNKFTEAYAMLGDLYRMKRQHGSAVVNYQKVLSIAPDYNRAIYLKIGDSEISDGKYAPAQQHLEKYLTYQDISPQNKSLAEKLIADCKFAINAMQHPVTFKPVNMGSAINTADDEYLPVATADEAQIIFTRKVNKNEDFYKSLKQADQWQPAVYLSDVINTPKYNEGAQSISQDGRYLFFTGCNRPDGLGRCDIYIAQKDGNDWKKPFSLSAPLNTGGWEAQPSISADGRTLYFVSNRKGGYGGYDIWKSKLTEQGWGEPENMGPNINTPYDEQSPFIHPDDNTFYFCSSGWPGMGGRDLFVSRLGKDGKWQKPENLGYPINSSGDENGLTLTANGAYAFFSSDNLKGFGGFDIYTFEMPAAIRPNIVTYVKGTVRDIKTKQPLEAAVEIVDLQRDAAVYQDYSSADEGKFLATLPAGKNYGLNISREGYLFYSDNFSLINLKDKRAFNIEVMLSPIEVGNKVVLKNIFFDTNKFDLKDESKTELQKLMEFLKLNPSVKIEISGYTDDVGNDELNTKLSENRAKAVYQYLTMHQINASRLVYKGYGKADPIAPNTNDDNRSKNRRTEFKIIGM